MKIDLSKLKNVKHLSGGKTTAQCPACAAEGADAKGEHLVIFAEGKFGCVVNDNDKSHNRKILQLAGANGGGNQSCRLTIERLKIPDSVVVMKVGRLGLRKAVATADFAHKSAKETGSNLPADKRPPVDLTPVVNSKEWPADGAPEGMDESLHLFLTEAVS